MTEGVSRQVLYRKLLEKANLAARTGETLWLTLVASVLIAVAITVVSYAIVR